MTERTGPRESAPRRRPDQAVVRLRNLETVARLVRDDGVVTRRFVGEALGFNKATVSSLVSELISRGLLAESGPQGAEGLGRPASGVHLDRQVHASVVVEILTDHVVISAWTLSMDRLSERTLDLHPTELGPEATMRGVADAVGTTIAALRRANRQVIGVLAALPGLIDTSSGTLLVSEPLGWQDVPIAAILRRRRSLANVATDVGRIANLATIAEWSRLPGVSDLVCLHCSETGLGAGLVVGGRLVTGNRGRAGEILFPPLAGSAAAGGQSRPPLALSEDAANRLRAELDRGGQRAQASTSELSEQLAARLGTVLALLDPSTVVLGGTLVTLGAHLHDRLTSTLHKVLAPRSEADVDLRFGSYAAEAARMGGAIQLTEGALDLTGSG